MTKLTDEWGFFTPMPEVVIEMAAELGSDAVFLFMYLRYKTHRRSGSAWPSYTKMHEDFRWGRRRISNALKVLTDAKLLSKRKRFSGSTVYTLTRPPDVGVSNENGAISRAPTLMDAPIRPVARPQQSRSATTLDPERDSTQDLLLKTDNSRPKRGRVSSHPLSLQVFRSVTHRNIPKKYQERVHRAIGDEFFDCLEWGRTVKWWAMSGYKVTNYTGMLEVFETRRGRNGPVRIGGFADDADK